MKSLKILDCTLRDGGYYNNWDFDAIVVEEYLAAISKSKIDYVELGLRNFKKDSFLGPFAYTTERFLNSINLPIGPKYGVMIDAKTILDSHLKNQDAIKELFVDSRHSKIDVVRVAAHFHEVEDCGEIIKILSDLGYEVGFNLMQAGGKSEEIILNKVKMISKWQGLNVLYFADSLGNMDSYEVKRIVNTIKNEWKGELGIHTHDNMGKGLLNCLAAIDLDVNWIDATVTGMGRGAGNTQTEYLLATIENTKYNPKPVYELAIKYFEEMKKKFGWGNNLLYFLAAKNDIHPTYIQNMLSNTNYEKDEIVGALNYLSEVDGTSAYNDLVLNTALQLVCNEEKVSGDNKIKDVFNEKDVLLVTNAPSTKKYLKDIINYIVEYKPVVISINISKYLEQKYIDYYVVSHNSKYFTDSKLYSDLEKPIILPKHRFTHEELAMLGNKKIYDFGLIVEDGKFELHDNHAVIPHNNTTGYLLAILCLSKPKSIKAIGFDGYESHDQRYAEMVNLLDKFNSNSAIKITSLTPTTYPIHKSSIYAPF